MQKHQVAIALILAAGAGGFYGWSRGKAAVAPAESSRCALAALTTVHPGMVWVPGGAFTMGSDASFPEEAPAVAARVAGFWMDQTEVTNAQFAQFVTATGYRTLAETAAVGGSAVFQPHGDPDSLRALANWWQFMRGANWRHPGGPGTSLVGMDHHPVVHIAYEDALAYAKWKGRSLPSEEQFEFAAGSSARKDAAGAWTANTWQGSFPAVNIAADGYAATAPVGCFAANKLGLHDLIGNVWEWTTSLYYPRHGFAAAAAHPRGLDPRQPDEAVAVLKGGSYLCSPDYCMRYRPEARIGQPLGLGAAHIGFRTVLNP